MLKPAKLYEDILREEFTKVAYTDEFMLYTGYGHMHSISNFDLQDNVYSYAVVDKEDNLVGYISYRVDPWLSVAYNFGIYSFVKDTITLANDLYEIMKSLIATYHRIEWRMIAGNPVERSYDALLKKFNGRKITLKDSTKDNYGNYHDEYIYEILTNAHLNMLQNMQIKIKM